jgi:hypothetical protein
VSRHIGMGGNGQWLTWVAALVVVAVIGSAAFAGWAMFIYEPTPVLVSQASPVPSPLPTTAVPSVAVAETQSLPSPTPTQPPVTDTPTSLPVVEPTATAPPPTEPPPTPTPTSPPAPSSLDTGFDYGINVHLFGQEGQPIRDAVNELGFHWVKHQVRWNEIEPQKGEYVWSEVDRLARTCQKGNLKLLVSVVTSPDWARSTTEEQGPPANYQDFWNFLAEMAERYDGDGDRDAPDSPRIHAYEIWNEQNLRREWCCGGLNAARYVELLRGAYQTLKGVDPRVIVVSGAPTPTGTDDGVNAIDDRTYLQQMYDAGLRDVCDAIGVHPSGFANPPDALFTGSDYDPTRGWDDHTSFFFRNTMEDYHNIIVRNGDNKKLWATEFGWASNDGLGVDSCTGWEYAADVTAQQQANYLVKAYQMSKDWGWAGVMFAWNLNMGTVYGLECPQGEVGRFSILTPDWQRRPAFDALARMSK